MNANVVRTMFWTVLLVLLLGQNSANVVTASGGGTMPLPPLPGSGGAMASTNWMAGAGGTMPLPPPPPPGSGVTLSIVS